MSPKRAFYDLQVRFARTAARHAGMPLAAAMLDCTNLYVRFGAGRAFDRTHPLWAAYLHGLDEHASVKRSASGRGVICSAARRIRRRLRLSRRLAASLTCMNRMAERACTSTLKRITACRRSIPGDAPRATASCGR